MNDSFLHANGQPKVSLLIDSFNRCAPAMPGGIEWLDQVRLCNGPTDSPDGRKHSSSTDPKDKAFPWENASNCKPFVADDVINELTARDLAAFWRSMIQRGAGQSEEAGYGVSLIEHLVFGPMMSKLDKEVELSAQLRLSRGWCVLAPRWKQEFALRKYEVTMAQIEQLAQASPPESPWHWLPALIMDPTMEVDALALLRQWYENYVLANVPEKFRDRAPKIPEARLRKALTALRTEQKASVPLPYICRNEAEVEALEPWREVFIPPELTDTNDLVYQVEYVTEPSLRGRIVSEGYSAEWVEEAVKNKGVVNNSQLPIRRDALGVRGLLAGGSASTEGQSGISPNSTTGLIEIIHAVYRAVDEDGVQAAYCTVLHRNVQKNAAGKELFAKHEIVEMVNGDLPYVELVMEWRNRAITSSRSVPEMVSTQQKLIKDTLDQVIDRGSITILPPVNVYEAPSGAKYNFGPAAQNYVRQGREPQFMQIPSGQGMADGVAVYNVVKKVVDNRFGLMAEDVPPSRMQTAQEKSVRRFLIAWTRAFQQVLGLYQIHGDDAEFSRVTGAPEGWLESKRNTPGALSGIFDFDVRELDSEMFIEQVKAMNTIVLPNDVLSVIERGQYAAWMARGIVGPRVAKSFLRSVPDANAALKEKAEMQVLKMFAGTPPTLIDKDDPTAASLLQFTQQCVLQNPNYARSLTDEALVMVAGPQQAQQMAQQIGQRTPNQLFSDLLIKWIENLKFIGVTQQQNKQIGRMGVDPNAG